MCLVAVHKAVEDQVLYRRATIRKIKITNCWACDWTAPVQILLLCRSLVSRSARCPWLTYDWPFRVVSKKTRLPINGLDCRGMPGGRAYVIDSPELAVSLKRYPSKISFWHVGALFTGKVAGLSPFTARAVVHNVNGKDGQPSYSR